MILADEYQDATKEKTKSSVSSDTTLLQRAAWDVKIDNSECHGTFSILVAVEIWRLSESLITVGMWLAFGVVWGLVTGFFLTSGDVSVMNHMIPFVGESGYADTASSGNTILDILKNGTTIYSTKPQFASGSGLSAGTLSTTSFAVNDRLTFKITAIGATPGQGVRFTLKCKV